MYQMSSRQKLLGILSHGGGKISITCYILLGPILPHFVAHGSSLNAGKYRFLPYCNTYWSQIAVKIEANHQLSIAFKRSLVSNKFQPFFASSSDVIGGPFPTMQELGLVPVISKSLGMCKKF